MAFRQSAAQGATPKVNWGNAPTHAAQIGLSLAMEADSKGFGCGLKKIGSPEVVAPRTTPTPRTYNRFVTMVHRVVEFGMDVFV